jgi:hypothetical protein
MAQPHSARSVPNEVPRIRAQQILAQAVGPAPWYWQTFPDVTGPGGRRFTWHYHGEQGPLAYLVTLNPRQDPSVNVLALNTYCRAFPIGAAHLGIWCPEAPSALTGTPYIRLLCFDPEQLKPFPLEEIAGWFKPSNERVYAATPPLAEFEISAGLAPGDHAIDPPPQFRGAGELLIVSPLATPEKTGPTCAILVLDPGAGRLRVLPQRWFTAAHFDTGYQWITRVARDPVTGRIVGEGMRIQPFELSEDGCGLQRWLD